MKKIYVKPTLMKRDRLSNVTAEQPVSWTMTA
ncbi:MAG: putative RiPP precursor [Mesorhizobium sp.]